MNRRTFLKILPLPLLAGAAQNQLSEEHVRNVCRENQEGKRCRYLDEAGDKDICLKLWPRLRRIIDEKVAVFKSEQPTSDVMSRVPLGDNCDGVRHTLRFMSKVSAQYREFQ